MVHQGMFRRSRFRRQTNLHRLLHRRTRWQREVHFLQIGTCRASPDDIHDPLLPFRTRKPSRWRGVLVEPLPHCCEHLRRVFHTNPTLRIEEAAVAVTAGTQPLYRIAFERDDVLTDRTELGWMDGFSTLSLDEMEGFILRCEAFTQYCEANNSPIPAKDWLQWVRPISVRTITMQDAMALVTPRGPDVIVIDTEGLDAELICSTDFSDGVCKTLVFEQVRMDGDSRAEVIQHLQQFGFRILPEAYEDDGVAVRD